MINSRIKFLFTFLFALNFCFTNAQEEQSKEQAFVVNKFQVGVNFSPDNCFRTLVNNTDEFVYDQVISSYNVNDKSKNGFTAGLNFCYNFNKSIAIESGIYFSNKGYQSIIEMKKNFLPDPNLLTKMRFVYSYYYIDIPIKANFTFGKKKLRFTTSIGLVANRFMKGTDVIYLEYLDSKKNENKSRILKIILTKEIFRQQ